MQKKTLFLIVGTRPEAIKVAPVFHAFKNHPKFKLKIVLTAQHRSMLDQVVDFFGLEVSYDLNLMKPNQTLEDTTANVLFGLREIFNIDKPDLILVHGDTTTTMAASLSAYYHKIPVGHIEAGLRTGDIYAPFPEEMNRKLAGSLSTFHFAPTEISKQNLLREGISPAQIAVTGNTVIDALFDGLNRIKSSQKPYAVDQVIDSSKKLLLITGHRRENFGEGFINICKALKTVSESEPDVQILYPVHLNPNVQEPVYQLLSNQPNISLIEPLAYEEFIYTMNKAYLILTDSGGIQEEAPSLGKPVLVMREKTERPEAVEAGTVLLVGTDTDKIVDSVHSLLHDSETYKRMSQAHNPYGDGKASERILNFLETHDF